MRNVVVKVYYEQFHIRVPVYDTDMDDDMLALEAIAIVSDYFPDNTRRVAGYEFIQIEELEWLP